MVNLYSVNNKFLIKNRKQVIRRQLIYLMHRISITRRKFSLISARIARLDLALFLTKIIS